MTIRLIGLIFEKEGVSDGANQNRIRIHSNGMRMRSVHRLLRKFTGIFGSLRY